MTEEKPVMTIKGDDAKAIHTALKAGSGFTYILQDDGSLKVYAD